MVDRLRILFVEDEPTDVEVEQLELERQGLVFSSRIAANESELNHQLATFNPDVVLCDYTMRGYSGLRALETTRRLQPATPVVMVSGSIAEDTAIECLKCGATDYLLKANLRRLPSAVRRAVVESRQRRELEHRIDRLAHYDPLTGLPNLAHIRQMVRCFIELGSDAAAPMALVVLNLDRFQFVDEAFGRKHADELLKDIGAALKAESPQPDCIARIGADEFLLVLRDIGGAAQAGELVGRMLDAVGRPRVVGAKTLKLSASAGIALFPKDGSDFENLFTNASAALREAKVERGNFKFHSEEATIRTRYRWQLETELRSAIENAELTLFYQPQFEIASGKVCGVEALARWFLPGGKAISPSVFIPMAEQHGLIGPLGAWALNSGCRTAASWPGIGSAAPICINVSAQQICEVFTEVIADALTSSGLSAQQLELEITESVLVHDPDLVLTCLRQWKQLGVRIAVDDFGTGYSNLGYLSRLPIDRLKIDRSLIEHLTIDSREATVVRAMIALGRELGFTVVAEGVETEEQFAMLREAGCHQTQGFLLSAPTAATQLCAVMNRRWGMRHAGWDASVAQT
jgi:diguanylate cyclase (GGDEF)-like protein